MGVKELSLWAGEEGEGSFGCYYFQSVTTSHCSFSPVEGEGIEEGDLREIFEGSEEIKARTS